MFYFAYGSNLNKDQMALRCPDAVPIGRLVLPSARLVFRGVADVEYDENDSVQGGLWKITKDCEAALDRYEGVRKGGGLYLKKYIKVSIKVNGKRKTRRALIYVMNASHHHRASYYSMPSSFYLGVIRKGYRDFSLDGAELARAVAVTREASASEERALA